MPLDRLIPYARNARTHSDEQVVQIAASIVEFGWTNPILVDGQGNKARGIETEHPAVFPIKLAAFAMETWGEEGDLVYEPFSGSGTTIVAGQNTGRRVRAMELATEYVDVAILRWRELFPEMPVIHAETGQTFEAVVLARGKSVNE